jgi:site-specific DNA recombinase
LDRPPSHFSNGAKEADLVSLSEKIDTTTAAGKMVFRMLAVLSEFERDQISDRTRFALAHKRQIGEKTGGSVPFGYHSRKGKLYDNVEEQKTIALIIEWASKGETLRSICRKLEDGNSIRKNGSTTWHPQTVADILKRENTRKTA